MEQDNRHALALAREQGLLSQLRAINERSGRFGLQLWYYVKIMDK